MMSLSDLRNSVSLVLKNNMHLPTPESEVKLLALDDATSLS